MARRSPASSSAVSLACAAGLLAGAIGCGGGGSSSAPTAPSAPAGTPISASAGGTVLGLGGAASLVIPPGALSSNTAITLEAARGVALDPSVVTGSAVTFGPEVPFLAGQQAVLTLRYDPALMPSGIEETELSIHMLVGGSWRAVASRVFAVENEVNAPVPSTGTFSVRWLEPTTSCTSRESSQFDFWVGSWNFSAANSLPGTNDISKETNGCLIQERFRDTSGTQGRSVSFVSRVDGRWHQTYIDSRGGRLVLVGQFEDGQMRLYTSPTERFGWLPQGPDRIRYFQERTTDGGASWAVAFDSAYTRR